MIRFLEWDSLFFKLKIGRVDVDVATKENIMDLLFLKRQSGYELIYLFADLIDEKSKSWLCEKKITPVDIKTTFHKAILDQTQINDINIDKYVGVTSPKLLNLAFESGHKSRYLKDERLNFRFKDMYQTWIEKSVNGELADIVLASYHDNEIRGFVTIKKTIRSGIIGLIAVDKNFRGRGIGRGLLMAAEYWCSSVDCDELIVSTQSDNLEACNLYLKTGFTRLKSQYIFHI